MPVTEKPYAVGNDRDFTRVPGNRLLDALPSEDYRRIVGQASIVPLKTRQILYKQGAPIRDVYFPVGGVCSIVKVMEDGAMAEIASIGNEGMLGSSVYSGDDTSLGETVVQIGGGDALKLPAEAFMREMDRREAFFDCVMRYSHALSAQVTQTAACNALHFVEQRCARWLLAASDRVGNADLRLTHEALSIVLGVRRPSVTLALGELERAGLLESGRGVIRIANRPLLEQASCECYAAMKTRFSV